MAPAQGQSGVVFRVRGLGSRACGPSRSLTSWAARSCVDGLSRVGPAYRIAAFANQRHCRRRAQTSLSLFVSHSLYVADLEAIERNGENLPALRIREEFPTVRVGIDNGAADPAALEALIGTDWTRPSSEANLGTTPR